MTDVPVRSSTKRDGKHHTTFSICQKHSVGLFIKAYDPLRSGHFLFFNSVRRLDKINDYIRAFEMSNPNIWISSHHIRV